NLARTEALAGDLDRWRALVSRQSRRRRNLWRSCGLPVLIVLPALCFFASLPETTAASYERLHSFGFPDLMGELPSAPPIQASDGSLYGTASAGGRFNAGVVYRMNADGTGYRVLLHLGSTSGDADTPTTSLIEASDGALYGVTYYGGGKGVGVV